MNSQPLKPPQSIHPFLELKATPASATIVIKSGGLASGRKPVLEDLLVFLQGCGITHGIDWSRIGTALEKSEFDIELPIAKSDPPKSGKDARIHLPMVAENKAKPQILGDGRADFREVSSLIQVNSGTVVAQLLPAEEGIPGTDIYGNPIPAPRGRGIALIAGTNTKLSPDGLSAIATAAGQLVEKNGVVSVNSILEIEGGVNFKTGNVRFDGDVVVRGSVQDGFTVDAGGDLTVEGEVERGILISRRGGITVTAGVFGHGQGRIEAFGKVSLLSAQQTEINCRELEVGKSLLDCKVVTHSLEASKEECLIQGGKLICYGKAVLRDAGGDGIRTEITILDQQEEEFRAEKSKLEGEESLLKGELESLDRKLRAFKILIAKAGAGVKIPPKTAQEMKDVTEAFTKHRRRMTNISSEKSMLITELAKPKDKPYFLRINGMILGTVHFEMFHIRKLLDPSDSGKEYQVRAETGLTAFTILDPESNASESKH